MLKIFWIEELKKLRTFKDFRIEELKILRI